jgi:hypothetical protein
MPPPRLLLPGDVVHVASNSPDPLTVQAIDKQMDSALLIDEKGCLLATSVMTVSLCIHFGDFVCWEQADGKDCCGWVCKLELGMAQIAPILATDDISYLLVSCFYYSSGFQFNLFVALEAYI